MVKEFITIRQALPEDANLLAALGARTFATTFGLQNTPEDMEAYLEKAFAPDVMLAELNNSGNVFFLAFYENEPVGYIKLRQGKLPTCVTGPKPIELERIYVVTEYAGKGIGGLLKGQSLSTAHNLGFETIWLGVWKENDKALQVYFRWGFKIVGEQTFVLGEDVQFDWILARPVDPGPSDQQPQTKS